MVLAGGRRCRNAGSDGEPAAAVSDFTLGPPVLIGFVDGDTHVTPHRLCRSRGTGAEELGLVQDAGIRSTGTDSLVSFFYAAEIVFLVIAAERDRHPRGTGAGRSPIRCT